MSNISFTNFLLCPNESGSEMFVTADISTSHSGTAATINNCNFSAPEIIVYGLLPYRSNFHYVIWSTGFFFQKTNKQKVNRKG